MREFDSPLTRRERFVIRVIQAAVVLALIAAWRSLDATHDVSRLILPPMSDVLHRFGQILIGGGYWRDLGITLDEMWWSFLLSSIIGVAIGFLVSRRDLDRMVFEPLLAGLYSIPVIVIYPLYVLFFGLGQNSKIALGVTIGVFPIALSTIAGFGAAPNRLVNACRAMGASRWKTFRYLLLPAAFPIVFAGLRVGFILAFLSIIGGEMLASYGGVGRLIINEAEAMNTSRMYAYIIFLILFSLVLNFLLFAAEERLSRRWRTK